jgi:hypothetical protein
MAFIDKEKAIQEILELFENQQISRMTPRILKVRWGVSTLPGSIPCRLPVLN